MQRIKEFFTTGVEGVDTAETVGMEVETSFVDGNGSPVRLEVSQDILIGLVESGWWSIKEKKGSMLTKVEDVRGNTILYELGRQNIEVATTATNARVVVGEVRSILDVLYAHAERLGAYPTFEPILHTKEDLLVVPDERDETWIALDGRPALAEIAKMSSVQCTLSVAPQRAISVLNNLGEHLDSFVAEYPQDMMWQEYIRTSHAAYRADRYGGARTYADMDAYCRALASHDVVRGGSLVPWGEAGDVDIPLHIRSVWWHFRLKRYNNTLCIEVRPQARCSDDMLDDQLARVLDIVL